MQRNGHEKRCVNVIRYLLFSKSPFVFQQCVKQFPHRRSHPIGEYFPEEGTITNLISTACSFDMLF